MIQCVKLGRISHPMTHYMHNLSNDQVSPYTETIHDTVCQTRSNIPPYDTLHACIINGNSVYMAWNIFVAGVNPKPTGKDRQVARLVAGPVHLANDETRQTRNLATI